jgi:hypothetical protein
MQWTGDYHGDLVAAMGVCDSMESSCGSKNVLCNKAQTEFESSHCQLSVKLLDTCLELNNCYNNTKVSYDSLEVGVKEKEVSQKQMWTAERKISCYLNVFALAETRNLLSADITNCSQNLQVNVGHLDIQYPALPGKDACDDSLAYWQAAEYDALNATYIQTTMQCCLDSINSMKGPAPPAPPAPPSVFEVGTVTQAEYKGHQEYSTQDLAKTACRGNSECKGIYLSSNGKYRQLTNKAGGSTWRRQFPNVNVMQVWKNDGFAMRG